MFKKSFIAMAVAVGMTGATHAAENSKQFGWQHKVNHIINAEAEVASDASGRNRYMVQLVDKPAALHASELLEKENGFSILGLKKFRSPQKPAAVMQAALKTSAMTNYRQQVNKHQATFMNGAKKALGRELKPVLKFDLAYNGMVLDLTPAEAEELLKQPQVMRVIKEVPNQLHLDNGPDHIGSGAIWDGSATGVDGAMGEGVVIGILDTGVNTDNAAFAATGGDGYTVQNPLGTGNYLGDCKIDASLCNDKLIGVYSFDAITANYDGLRAANGEDYNGHGSHTASTAGGNILLDVPVLRPSVGEAVGDGIESGSLLPQISGVAPHANIIAYQVCDNNGCYPSLTVASVEQAIEDGVDVINYSIGPTGAQADPWSDVSHIAFLSAREAGIFVAASAGNAGPGPYTTGNNSPWTTTVGASTHQRTWVHDVAGSSEMGATFEPVDGYADIYVMDLANPGRTNTVLTPTEVVYAGDFEDRNGNNMALCDQSVSFIDPLSDAWKDKIVVCDRGEIPLVEKLSNIRNTFTNRIGGIIIRSTAQSEQNMAAIRYDYVAGALLNRADGQALLDWMNTTRAAGDVPMLTIGAGKPQYEPALADEMARFSSRGPYAARPGVMVPNISAPGVDVYAAYSDEQPFHGDGAAPADFSFLSGTSMASPHVAGAAALVHQVHPDWTPAEIQSAMMLTADATVTKRDDAGNVSSAGYFDTGSGRLQVDKTVQAGLIMDVPIADYMTVSSDHRGDYTTLNMPYLSNSECPGTCTWSRTFTATEDGNWDVSVAGDIDGLSLSASPSSFDIAAGESVTVKFTATVAQRVSEDWSFLRVQLNPTHESPALSMPVAIKPMIAGIPENMSRDHYWSRGEVNVGEAQFRYPGNAMVVAAPLQRATSYPLTLAADTDSASPFDDLGDGTAIQYIDVPEGNGELRVIVGDTTAKDVDLFVGQDSNNDGIPQVVEISQVCATTLSVDESCRFAAGTGRYWVLVHNYKGSDAETDSVRLDVVMSPSSETQDATARMASSYLNPYDLVDVSLNWVGDLGEGVYYGNLEFFDRVSSSATRAVGNTQVKINRTAPEAQIVATQPELSRGQEAVVTITLPANGTAEDVTYQVTLDSDAELAISDVSAEGEAQASASGDTVSITVAAGAEGATAVVKLAQPEPKSGEFTVHWTLDTEREGFSSQKGEFTVSNSNHAPEIAGARSLTGDMGSVLNFSANATDADGDELSYTLVQTSGPAVDINHEGDGNFALSLPEVDTDRTAVFELSASDGEFSVTSQLHLTIDRVAEKKKSGGSAGFGFLLLGLIAGLLRRRHI
ncbi:S8 family serine peptidase [uncultured Microbulbifer sp.]|uniref:S8 family serine peptidase n=1 Tax=uncultured Microbulbifer sp. TaxID=348147 RepID=UPI0025DC1C5A|nr:S8 family serine peptidase [uncultured Microbulbifer sp.]